MSAALPVSGRPGPPSVSVDVIERFQRGDLEDLCDAAELAIKDGGGFGWVTVPAREALERYWRGVLAVPERTLFVGRLDGVIAGSAQLVRPSRNNEAQAHAAHLTTSFVAPWARGHGLARLLTESVERRAATDGFLVLNLDVRETQMAAIRLYETLGYALFGQHAHYARIRGRWVAGRYYTKLLAAEPPRPTLTA